MILLDEADRCSRDRDDYVGSPAYGEPSIRRLISLCEQYESAKEEMESGLFPLRRPLPRPPRLYFGHLPEEWERCWDNLGSVLQETLDSAERSVLWVLMSFCLMLSSGLALMLFGMWFIL